MKGCIILYDKVNLLSFAKIYDFFIKNELKFEVVSLRDELSDERGFRLLATKYAESLYGYDIVAFPDGIGALNLRYDDIFLSWIKSANKAKLKIGLDLGSLIMGGAGFLQDKSAVIRGGYKNALKEFCVPLDAEFCFEEGVVSLIDSKLSWEELEKLVLNNNYFCSNN